MNKYWSGLVAAGAMAAAVTLAGQSQSPVNTPPPDVASPPGVQRTPTAPSAQTPRTGNTVTISGCIENAPAMAGNTGAGAGVAGGGAAGADRGATAGSRATTTESSFVLANASMTGGNAGADRGAVGTSGSVSTYKLEGDASTLSPHLNHQVRITGTLQDSAASATGAANAAPRSTAAGPTLKVESVTMVADTCTSAAAPQGREGAQPQGNRPQGAGGGNTTPGSNQGNTTRPQP